MTNHELRITYTFQKPTIEENNRRNKGKEWFEKGDYEGNIIFTVEKINNIGYVVDTFKSEKYRLAKNSKNTGSPCVPDYTNLESLDDLKELVEREARDTFESRVLEQERVSNLKKSISDYLKIDEKGNEPKKPESIPDPDMKSKKVRQLVYENFKLGTTSMGNDYHFKMSDEDYEEIRDKKDVIVKFERSNQGGSSAIDIFGTLKFYPHHPLAMHLPADETSGKDKIGWGEQMTYLVDGKNLGKIKSNKYMHIKKMTITY